MYFAGRDNVSVQECSVGKEASSTSRSSQAKSAGLVDYCHCSEEVKNILESLCFRLATCSSVKLTFIAFILYMKNDSAKRFRVSGEL